MEPKFEFVMSVRLKLGNLKKVGNLTKGGARCFIDVAEGTFEGPRLKGIVVSGTGGDFAHVRPDGVLDFDARYFLQEEDGSYIYLMNRGFRWASPEVMQKLSDRILVDPSEYYMRVCLTFEVQAGPHDWLCKHVFVGIGNKTPEGNVIDYYMML